MYGAVCPNSLEAALYLSRYLKGPGKTGFECKTYRRPEHVLLEYSNSDFAGDKDDHKPTSGLPFVIAEGAAIWNSKNQSITAQ